MYIVHQIRVIPISIVIDISPGPAALRCLCNENNVAIKWLVQGWGAGAGAAWRKKTGAGAEA